jgi:hypothetical protein
MQRDGLASFVSEAGLYLALASPFHNEEPLHLLAPIFVPTLASQYREHAVARTITHISRCGESQPMQRIWATYRDCSPRPGARWGQNDRDIAHSNPAAHSTEYYRKFSLRESSLVTL